MADREAPTITNDTWRASGSLMFIRRGWCNRAPHSSERRCAASALERGILDRDGASPLHKVLDGPRRVPGKPDADDDALEILLIDHQRGPGWNLSSTTPAAMTLALRPSSVRVSGRTTLVSAAFTMIGGDHAAGGHVDAPVSRDREGRVGLCAGHLAGPCALGQTARVQAVDSDAPHNVRWSRRAVAVPRCARDL